MDEAGIKDDTRQKIAQLSLQCYQCIPPKRKYQMHGAPVSG